MKAFPGWKNGGGDTPTPKLYLKHPYVCKSGVVSLFFSLMGRYGKGPL